MVNKLWISEVEGRGYQQSVPCVLKMHTRHVNTGITSREKSDNRPEKLRQVAAAAPPPPPRPAQFSRRPSRVIVYTLLWIIYDSMSSLMKDGLQGIQGAAMVLRPEEPSRHLHEWSEDNQENSVQNCVLNLSFLPVWWMAHLAETRWWCNTQKNNCGGWLHLLWFLLPKTQRKWNVLKLSKPLVPSSLSLHTFQEAVFTVLYV